MHYHTYIYACIYLYVATHSCTHSITSLHGCISLLLINTQIFYLVINYVSAVWTNNLFRLREIELSYVLIETLRGIKQEFLCIIIYEKPFS